MWFKNLRLYHLRQDLACSLAELDEALAEQVFKPCGSQEPQRSGWVSPLGRRSEVLAHVVGDCAAIAMKTEERILPGSVVREALEEKVAEISDSEGRSVGRKERQSLRDDIEFSLMPKAFTRSQVTYAYIDLKLGAVIVNAASANKAEALLNLLREGIGSLSVVPMLPKQPVSAVMSDWLVKSDTQCALQFGEECDLLAPKDGRQMKVKHVDLTSDELITHVKSGMRVQKMALQWGDDAQFVLDDQFAIKRLKFGEKVLEQAQNATIDDEAQAFDQEFAVMCTELRGLLGVLLPAFGGLDTAPA